MLYIKNAKFIVPAGDFGTVCPIFGKHFSASKPVRSAVAEISALGVYEAQLNGKRLGDFIMAPGWTAHQARQQVQRYDITDLLSAENDIEITVGDGWVVHNMNNHYGDVDGKRTIEQPVAIAAIHIEYEDGTAETVVTDTTWKASKSAFLSDTIYNGETYDARLAAVRVWEDTAEYDYSTDVLIAQEGEIVREIETLDAVEILTTPKGETVVDFGQNMTGYVQFTVQGAPGDVVEFDHAEVLDAEGNFYNDNYRSAKALMRYTCAGGTETHKPHLTFYGFRYIRLRQWPGEADKSMFKAIVVHSDMKRTGHFECSDAMVNQLYHNVIWGQKGNFLDVPTDCPQRDERLGWTGDANVFSRTAAYNYDVEKFFTKWLADLRADQAENGAIPDIIPAVFKREYSSAFWGDAACVIPWEMYLAYGNRDLLETSFESMRKYVESMRRAGSCEYLYDTFDHFGDWLALDGVFDDRTDNTNEKYRKVLATTAFAYSTELLIKAGEVLGKDMSEYKELHRGIVRTFNDRYVVDGDLIYKTQTMYVVALKFHLVEDKALYAERLVRQIRENGNRLNTGFVGTAYLMDALTENGYADVAYTLLLQKEFPSWLFSVRMGATTIWEHWDGMKADGTMWSDEMNSFNHYAYGAVASWMYGTMCGIKPDEKNPGYKHILIAPIPDERIEWAKASLQTRHGLVKSAWEHRDGTVVYTITVPDGVTAEITIGDETETVGGGEYTFVQ